MKVQGEQKEDMRVTRTRRNIREAFLRASLEKNPDEMKISDLAKDAGIARKTVYLHYKNTDEIADDICDRLTAEIIPELTGDMANDIETIYAFFDDADEPIYKLLFGGGTADFGIDFSIKSSHLMPSASGTRIRNTDLWSKAI